MPAESRGETRISIGETLEGGSQMKTEKELATDRALGCRAYEL